MPLDGFELWADEGLSLRGIAAKLDAEGITSKRASKWRARDRLSGDRSLVNIARCIPDQGKPYLLYGD